MCGFSHDRSWKACSGGFPDLTPPITARSRIPKAAKAQASRPRPGRSFFRWSERHPRGSKRGFADACFSGIIFVGRVNFSEQCFFRIYPLIITPKRIRSLPPKVSNRPSARRTISRLWGCAPPRGRSDREKPAMFSDLHSVVGLAGFTGDGRVMRIAEAEVWRTYGRSASSKKGAGRFLERNISA